MVASPCPTSLSFYYFFPVVLGIKPKTSHVLSEHPTPELYPSPSLLPFAVGPRIPQVEAPWGVVNKSQMWDWIQTMSSWNHNIPGRDSPMLFPKVLPSAHLVQKLRGSLILARCVYVCLWPSRSFSSLQDRNQTWLAKRGLKSFIAGAGVVA